MLELSADVNGDTIPEVRRGLFWDQAIKQHLGFFAVITRRIGRDF